MITSNVFSFWCERAVEAIAFADPHQLAELGEFLQRVCSDLGRSAGRGDATACAEHMLRCAKDSHVLREIASAHRTRLAENESAEPANDPAADLLRVGQRALPFMLREDGAQSARYQASLAMRFGIDFIEKLPSCYTREGRAAYALGMRLGRSLAQAWPVFSGPLQERLLPALETSELLRLANFCSLFGHCTTAALAQHTGQREQQRRALAEAHALASELSEDPELTPRGRALLTRIPPAEQAA